MRTRLIWNGSWIFALVFSQCASAQQTRRPRPAEAPVVNSGPFDAHDLSGVWMRKGGDRSIESKHIPPLTPEGEAKLKTHIPARGRPAGEPLNGENPALVRAVVPALSNDPMMTCNPQGFPRLLLDPEFVEFGEFRGRILQLFQWSRTLRELWLDGRALPSGENLDNLGPAWYGHSVAHWEGDTLVVETVGMDDRAWVDIYGLPKSSEARIEERYRRVDPDTIQLNLTMFDPKYYKEPWVSDLKTFKRVKPEAVTNFGWYGLFGGATEAICAPLNEVEDFNKRIRDPAGLGVTQK